MLIILHHTLSRILSTKRGSIMPKKHCKSWRGTTFHLQKRKRKKAVQSKSFYGLMISDKRRKWSILLKTTKNGFKSTFKYPNYIRSKISKGGSFPGLKFKKCTQRIAGDMDLVVQLAVKLRDFRNISTASLRNARMLRKIHATLHKDSTFSKYWETYRTPSVSTPAYY